MRDIMLMNNICIIFLFLYFDRFVFLESLHLSLDKDNRKLVGRKTIVDN